MVYLDMMALKVQWVPKEIVETRASRASVVQKAKEVKMVLA